MSDNQATEANRRVKDAGGSFTGDQIVKNDRQADQARTTAKDKGNNLVDTLPGRGSEWHARAHIAPPRAAVVRD